MSISLRWVGEDELDRVALTRLRCYAKGNNELPRFVETIRKDTRAGPGDYVLAESGGQAVGTATHLRLQMFVRNGVVPCQGVAWVGAIKTMRRKGDGGSPGIASAVMAAVLRKARDNGDVVSALMPFRASYYEHFGYGIVERRIDWTVPLSALPAGDFDGVRFYEASDFTARCECLRRVNSKGQCDFARSDDQWRAMDQAADDGLQVIDRTGDGPVHGSMVLLHQQVNGKDIVRVTDQIYEGPAALRRQLCFLASLKDQFATALLTLPADVPLNRLLKEPQIPHRPVNHAVAEARPFTRMQARILDHAKFLEAMHLPEDSRGSVTAAVRECEGHVSRFKVDLHAGRATCKPAAATADFECPDRVWAGIACGDLLATDAVKWGLATGNGEVLNSLGRGPLPFSNEYF